MFAGKKQKSNWNEKLAASLKKPTVSMSRLESAAWRIRRNYIFLFPFLFVAWLSKISASGQLNISQSIIENASIGIVPGYLVFMGFLGSLLYILAIAYYLPVTSTADDLP